jgi:NADH-quinone oxidoreductase subunit H
VKVMFFIFAYIWIRWTLPRFRYDQLMSLGWKFMLPLALAYIVIIATATLGLDIAGVPRDWRFGLALTGLNVVLLILLFVILDRGRIISPASGRLRAAEVARLRSASRRSTLTAGAGD